MLLYYFYFCMNAFLFCNCLHQNCLWTELVITILRLYRFIVRTILTNKCFPDNFTKFQTISFPDHFKIATSEVRKYKHKAIWIKAYDWNIP